MQYTVNIANNLRTLVPGLPQKVLVNSDYALTVFEIAQRAGIPQLLVVGGIIDGRLHPIDQPVEQESEIVLLGPVAGG